MGLLSKIFGDKKDETVVKSKVLLDPKQAAEQEKTFLDSYAQSSVEKQKMMALALLRASEYFINSDRAKGV